LAGCERGNPDPKTPAPERNQQPTDNAGVTPQGRSQGPAEVFTAAKKALQDKDFKQYATLLTDESRAALAGSLLLPRVALNRRIDDCKPGVRFPPLRKPPAADQQEVEQHVREMEAGFKALTDVYTRHELTEDTFRNVADALRELDPAQPDVRRFRR